MRDRPASRFHRHLIGTLWTIAVLVVCAVLFIWAWNTLAVDLFKLPRAQFKHALAFEAALAGLVMLTAWFGRGVRRWRGREAVPQPK